MEEYSSKRGVDGMVVPKRRTGLVLRETSNSRDQNYQNRSRVSCSSAPNPPKVAQVKSSEKGKILRPSVPPSSSGKEVVGSSRRTSANPARPLKEPRRTLPSSGLPAEEEGRASTNVIRAEVAKSGAVSSSRSQRNFNQRPGLRQRENESIVPATQAVSSKYGLRNLRCNTISDVIPSCSSSDSTLNRKKATVIKKRSSEGESSSTVKGKKMTGSSSEGLNSGSRNGRSRSDARGSKNIPPPRDNSRATVRTERSVSGYARGRFSSQGNENSRGTNESLDVLPISGHSIDLNSPVTEEFCGIMPTSPEEYRTHHSLIIQDGLRGRYNIDDISEVLLALERMEQDEELTHEQIDLLENNLILDGLSFYDNHRNMRLDIDNMSYEELLALEERMGTVSTALTEEALSDSIKRSVYESAPPDDADTAHCVDDDKDDIKCCICQEEYVAGDEIGGLQCTHQYHVDCIQEWLRLKNWCPMCKESAALSNSSSSH